MKKALITGITGQDGSYLAELLLKKGYEVHGIKRRSSLFNTGRIDHFYQDPHIPDRHLVLHHGDLTDSTTLIRIIQEVQPDEIYNLAAMSHKLRRTRIHCQRRWYWYVENTRSGSFVGIGEENKSIPGINVRIVWIGSGCPTKRNNSFLST